MASLAASLLRPRILSNLKMRTCVWRHDRRNTWMGGDFGSVCISDTELNYINLRFRAMKQHIVVKIDVAGMCKGLVE